MFLKFKAPPEGARANYKLTTDSEKAFPKGVRSLFRPGWIDGKPVTFAITSSANYALKVDAGANGWIRWEGKVRWFLFDTCVDAVNVSLDFVSGEGGETPNPVRAPKSMTREMDRRKAFRETYNARYRGVNRTYSDQMSEADLSNDFPDQADIDESIAAIDSKISEVERYSFNAEVPIDGEVTELADSMTEPAKRKKSKR